MKKDLLKNKGWVHTGHCPTTSNDVKDLTTLVVRAHRAVYTHGWE